MIKLKGPIVSWVSIFTILIIWKIFALVIGAEVILPAPETVLKSLFTIITEKQFLKRISYTLLRGVLGFLISFALGLIIGVLAGIFNTFRRIVAPVISIIRSTPVMAIILLALIWFNVNYVPIFVAFLMGFPIICGNMIEGITTVDKNLLEMAKTYNISIKKQILHIYIPSTVPFIIASASLSLGVIWKVVVAAEVLSQPKWGVGTSLNEAKAFLITEEVFAWTVIAILLSALSELIFSRISKNISGKRYGN